MGSRTRGTDDEVFTVFAFLDTSVAELESLLELAGLYLIPDELVFAVVWGGHGGCLGSRVELVAGGDEA